MGFLASIKVMKNLCIITIALFLIQCEPVVPQGSFVQKQLLFDNYEYEDLVGNVMLVPAQNGNVSELENPVVYLNERDRLLLNFDLLTDQFQDLSIKIYHCNKDWSKSGLRDMEFLSEINNFRVTDFDYSVNTVQPYINYRVTIPKPNISGNYVVAVFRRANPDDVLLTRRFLVINPVASIDHLVRMSTTIAKRNDNHQLEFTIRYGDLTVNSPTRDISVFLLQNHNWRTAKKDIPPTHVRANQGELEYRHLDLTTNFPGWNEFRFADLRTLSVAGRNVAAINSTDFKLSAQLGVDESRGNRPYSQNLRDINGNYIIQNNDIGEVPLNTDYATVQFNLKSDRIDGDVFVIGRYNNWRLSPENQMVYNAQSGMYHTNILLKQGYYEYLYHLESSSKPAYFFEGTHNLAENEYEILVYYRRPGNINDELVGYKRFPSRQP